MAANFCVFWIPTIFHTKILPLDLDSNLIEKDISDNVGGSHHICVSLDETTFDLTIISTIPDHNPITLNLKCLECSDNGLISYSYDTYDDIELHFIEGKIPNAIYHMVKGFYHEHRFHDPESDSPLDAFTSPEQILIHEVDNKALRHYLEKYEIKFVSFSEQLKFEFDYLKKENEENINKPSVFFKREEFNQKCNNILGEFVYCESLMNSKFNHSCKIQEIKKEKTEEEKNPIDLRKVAINIHNAVKYVQLLQIQNKAEFDFKSVSVNLSLAYDTKEALSQNTQLIKKNDTLGCIGLSVGVLGFFISIFSYYSTPNIKPIIESQNKISNGLYLLKSDVIDLNKTVISFTKKSEKHSSHKFR
jgi:hypothetical protein